MFWLFSRWLIRRQGYFREKYKYFPEKVRILELKCFNVVLQYCKTGNFVNVKLLGKDAAYLSIFLTRSIFVCLSIIMFKYYWYLSRGVKKKESFFYIYDKSVKNNNVISVYVNVKKKKEKKSVSYVQLGWWVKMLLLRDLSNPKPAYILFQITA